MSARAHATSSLKGISERKDQDGGLNGIKEKKKQETGVWKEGKTAHFLAFPRSTFLYLCAQRQSVKQILLCHGVVIKDTLEMWVLLLESGLDRNLTYSTFQDLWHFLFSR